LKKPKLLLITAILLISPIAFINIPRAFAQGGTVCISDPSNFSDCNTPASFVDKALTPGSTVSVNVNIQNSDPLNGFSVAVFADSSVISGSGMSFSGSILNSAGTMQVFRECINGIPFDNPISQTCPSTDGPGVVSADAVAQGAVIGSTGATSGNLFTITYTVKGFGDIPIGFNTGCSSSSVPPNCVTILNPSAPNGVNTGYSLVTGHFENLNDFSLAATPTDTSIKPSVQGTSRIDLAALGLFSDTVNLSVSSSAGITASLDQSSFSLSNGSTGTTTLRYVSSTPAGGNSANPPYQVNVTGTAMSGGQTHTVTVNVIVSNTDFLFCQCTGSPEVAPPTQSLVVSRGLSNSTSIGALSLSGFSGMVSLTATPSDSGLTASLDTGTLSLSPGTYGIGTLKTATLTMSASGSETPGTYSVMVTGTSGSIRHSLTIPIVVPVPDFAVIPIPNEVDNQPAHAPVIAAVNVVSIHGFSGSVTVSASIGGSGTVDYNSHPVAPSALTATLNSQSNPVTVNVSPGVTPTITLLVTEPSGTVALGNYTVTLTGTTSATPVVSPSESSSMLIVLVDYNITITKTSYLAYQGQTDLGIIGAEGLGGNTGFGVANLQSNFVGFNCLNTIVPVVRRTSPICVPGVPGAGPIYFFNTTLNTYVLVPNNQGLVQNGIVPVVRFNGRAVFPLPANSPLCFEFGYNDTPTHCDIGTPIPDNVGNGAAFFQVRAFAQTIPGTYKVFVDSSGNDEEHAIGNVTIRVPTPAEIDQLHFAHHLSLSKSGSAQTYTVGITNVNTDVSLNVIVTIKAIDTANPATVLTVASANFVLAPGKTMNNIALTMPLISSYIGHTFSFQVTLKWGVVGLNQSGSSTIAVTGIPSSGTFTVFA